MLLFSSKVILICLTNNLDLLILFLIVDSFVNSWRCEANIKDAPFWISVSMPLATIEIADIDSVPQHISSPITRLNLLHLLRIFLSSVISTVKLDIPLYILSNPDILVNML